MTRCILFQCQVKVEDEDPLRDGNDEVLHAPAPSGMASETSAPFATDNLVSALLQCLAQFFYDTNSFLGGKFP